MVRRHVRSDFAADVFVFPGGKVDPGDREVTLSGLVHDHPRPEFEGSVLLVSHDRALLDAVGTRTVTFEDGSLRSYAGGWAEFVRAQEVERAVMAPS